MTIAVTTQYSPLGDKMSHAPGSCVDKAGNVDKKTLVLFSVPELLTNTARLFTLLDFQFPLGFFLLLKEKNLCIATIDFFHSLVQDDLNSVRLWRQDGLGEFFCSKQNGTLYSTS